MICPNCKKETASIFRMCQNCKADLEKYREIRNEALEGTREYDNESTSFGYTGINPMIGFVDLLGPVGGLILMVLGVALTYLQFTHHVHYHSGRNYIYAPIAFFIGLFGIIAGIKRMRKRYALKMKKKKGEILD